MGRRGRGSAAEKIPPEKKACRVAARGTASDAVGIAKTYCSKWVKEAGAIRFAGCAHTAPLPDSLRATLPSRSRDASGRRFVSLELHVHVNELLGLADVFEESPALHPGEGPLQLIVGDRRRVDHVDAAFA